MERRTFIKCTGLAALNLMWGLNGRLWAGGSAHRRRLVVVLLRGAVDGLSVVVPYAESEYYGLRPNIAIPQPGKTDGAIKLDNRFALHPALARIHPLWEQGKLAFVHAGGSPDPSRSHFEAQDYMETGTPGTKTTPDGWMNRLIPYVPGPVGPTTAVNLGPVIPRILKGKATVTNVTLGPGGRPWSVLDRPRVGSAFDKLYSGDDPLSMAYKEGRAGRKALMESMQPAIDPMHTALDTRSVRNGANNPVRQLARLMRNDPKLTLAFFAVGGWDTHVNQGGVNGQLANRLRRLAEGLSLLGEGLGPELDNTVVVVMSEFGRTVRENGNGGSDHGHGNVMWLFGGNVNGRRVYGRWAGLTPNALYEGRDLPVFTDFRDVLSMVLVNHLQLQPNLIGTIFPDHTAQAGHLQGLIRS